MKKFLFTLAVVVMGSLVVQSCKDGAQNKSDDQNASIAQAEAVKAQAEAAKAQAEAEKAQAEAEKAQAEADKAKSQAAKAQTAASTVRAAVINDKDGWTNVRATASSNAAVVHVLYDGDVFYVEYVPGQSWLGVRLSANSQRIGWIYSKLVRLI